MYLFLSDYPTGHNQADFYIIAYLSRVLLALDKKQLGSVHFELYSNDESLISAFEFQCKQLGGLCQSIRTRENTEVPMVKPQQPPKKSPEGKLLHALNSPRALDPSFQNQLGLSKSDFTKAINSLAKNNQIKRSPESKKKWVRCKGHFTEQRLKCNTSEIVPNQMT
ncbi:MULTISPECIES: hypothetical protein [unclassified Vibrio]|uniref:Uncharacterized protein n=1 Tax=Vibrio sp. HB236076 TaxID=3232307 RepID=A0AB39HE86_9VIBR|nr:hypothetical protein [Vibrio sp. HB161653]MDP5255547.1 hypothetical protein [Vibrio sp. HB161653]